MHVCVCARVHAHVWVLLHAMHIVCISLVVRSWLAFFPLVIDSLPPGSGPSSQPDYAGISLGFKALEP